MSFALELCMDQFSAPETALGSEPGETLANHLRRKSGEILELWEGRVRESVPASKALDPLSLRNSIPLILKALANTIEKPEGTEESKIEMARVHGEERASRPKYSIDQVILEYRILRHAIFDILTPGLETNAHARSAIIDAIDIGIAEAAAAFANYQYRLREQFISALAHDLRTPLTAATASAQLILRQPEKIDSTQRLSARIVDSIARTDRMIEDLLDSNLVRSGGILPLELERSDLRIIVKTTLEEVTAALGNRFFYEPGETPIIGYWDVRYLKRAIENVLVNAVKYGDPVNLVKVVVKVNELKVSISIHNQGHPIEAQDLETLFDPFQRSNKRKNLGRTGWGIGLSLVKGVCQAHGGEVSVQSQAGAGTTFTLTLPLDARPPMTQAA